MFQIEIAGVNVLYTGDYSREEDRHLVMAEVPPVRPDVMICESTFGVHTLQPRKEKEEQFTSEFARTTEHGTGIVAQTWACAALVTNIVRRGGRCLMPISAFGNVQELLLILDEHWSNHPELHNIPIYYASGLAFRGMQVYRTYIHTMNDHVKSRFSRDRNDNPFAFKYVRNVKDFRKWKDSGPCVMMATPQMLQGYHSRELLENWAPDRKNGLIITGYSIEGTMAKVSTCGDVGLVAGKSGRTKMVAVRYEMTNMIIDAPPTCVARDSSSTSCYDTSRAYYYDEELIAVHIPLYLVFHRTC